jgi:hypothetical protein
MKVQGKITKILEKVTGQKKDGSGEWCKQSFVVTTDEQYNNLYAFEVFGDEKVTNLTKYNKVDDSVDVEFNVSTNEYQGRYYTTLQAWKITKANTTETALAQASEKLDTAFEPAGDLNEPDNDLPF